MNPARVERVYPDTSYWVARLSGADLFVTCDEDQHVLASAAGLESCYVH